MKPIITFIVPVRHPENSSDWADLARRLAETARSIAAQTSPAWRAIVVANADADIPELPTGFAIKRVSFPPNPLHDIAAHDRELVYESFRLDKGRRVLAGMLAAGETSYFMIVDDDDFVSRNLTKFVGEHCGENGWEVRMGWLWSEGSHVVMKHNDFHNACGSSLIIRADLYSLPAEFCDATDEFIKTMLGSHRKISGILASQGDPLAGLPFRGAIYRVGHSGAHSKSQGILQTNVFNRALIRYPRTLVRNILNFRWMGHAKQKEFFAR